MARGNRKPGRYANGALISSAKASMQTEAWKKRRRDADNLRNHMIAEGIKKPGKDYDAGHNAHGPGKHGWEKRSKNRAVETKNKNRRKLNIT